MEHDIRDIDEFPVLRYRELAELVTEEHLRKNASLGITARPDAVC